MSTQVQLRRDTSINWSNINPILKDGEIGIDLTNKKIKIGDGITSWNLLDYFTGDFNTLQNKPKIVTTLGLDDTTIPTSKAVLDKILEIEVGETSGLSNTSIFTAGENIVASQTEPRALYLHSNGKVYPSYVAGLKYVGVTTQSALKDEDIEITLYGIAKVDSLLPFTKYYVENVAASGNWIYRLNMPTPRYSLSGEVVNNKIYCIGGRNQSSTLQTNEEYDTVTNTWTSKANMPTGVNGFTSSVVDGKIYCIGGYNNSGVVQNLNQMYDPSTNGWTQKTVMTTARASLTSSVVDGKIYCIGGSNGSGNQNEMYDPVTNTWTSKTSMTTGRTFLGSAVVDGKIYCIGGSNFSQNEMYDPVTNTWTSKTSMLSARGEGFAIGVINNNIYCIGGGTNGGGNQSTNEYYSPETNTWITSTGLSTARKYLLGRVINGRLYCIGGHNGSTPLTTNEVFEPNETTFGKLTTTPTSILVGMTKSSTELILASNYL